VYILIMNFIFIIMSIFFSDAVKLLGFMCTVTFSFYTIDILLMLHFALVRSKLENASVARSSVMVTDSGKFEHMQIKFTVLCRSKVSHVIEYHRFDSQRVHWIFQLT
jgi:hypothetical protein